MTESATPTDILEFWLGEGFASGWPGRDMGKQWFGGGAELDRQVAGRFGAQVAEALAGGLARWEAGPLERLALVILLDQFPRNMFRGEARMFATDEQARTLAAAAIVRGFDAQVGADMRGFFYLPFMHSEDMADQELAIKLYAAADDAGGLKWAHLHADIIRRFGRFPHRNEVLGRTTTPEEQAFLDGGGFAG